MSYLGTHCYWMWLHHTQINMNTFHFSWRLFVRIASQDIKYIVNQNVCRHILIYENWWHIHTKTNFIFNGFYIKEFPSSSEWKLHSYKKDLFSEEKMCGTIEQNCSKDCIQVNMSVYIASLAYWFCWQHAIMLAWKGDQRLNQLSDRLKLNKLNNRVNLYNSDFFQMFRKIIDWIDI